LESYLLKTAFVIKLQANTACVHCILQIGPPKKTVALVKPSSEIDRLKFKLETWFLNKDHASNFD
jgi:hypothetical protein